MSELEDVAISVAEALGLHLNSTEEFYTDGKRVISVDGSNLFIDPYWFHRCLEYLQDQGYDIYFGVNGVKNSVAKSREDDTSIWYQTSCPFSQFPARAIHALVTQHAHKASATAR